MNRQFRQGGTATELTPEGRIVADVLTYDVLDDYGTAHMQDAYLAALEQRMPTLVWGHNWLSPLGRWTDGGNVIREDGSVALRLAGQFDDFDDVPLARQAFSQLRSGTVREFSIGFLIKRKRPSERFPGGIDILEGQIDEASPVIVGAVPGTGLVAVRHAMNRSPAGRRLFRAGGGVLVLYADDVAELVMLAAKGELSFVDAVEKIKEMGVAPEELVPEGQEDELSGGESKADPDASKGADEPAGGKPDGDPSHEGEPPAGENKDEEEKPAELDHEAIEADLSEVLELVGAL